MVIWAGKPIAEVARDLGIHDGTLGNWVGAWRREHPEPGQPLSPVERARVKELEDEVARLRRENEFLKMQRPSSRGSTGSGAVRGDRCGEGNYKIAWMCRLLGVPRSSFYSWRNKAETATAARRRQLAVQVRRVFDEGRVLTGAAGSRRS